MLVSVEFSCTSNKVNFDRSAAYKGRPQPSPVTSHEAGKPITLCLVMQAQLFYPK